ASAAGGVGRGRGVVMARCGGPGRSDARVEGPVWQVDAFHRVGQRATLQGVRREPQLAVPRANPVARLVLRDLERQQAFRSERVLALRVRYELRRAAELAALCLALGVKHRDRLTALALHIALLDLPAARAIAEAAKRRHQVVLDDLAGVRVELRRRHRAAEGADQ